MLEMLISFFIVAIIATILFVAFGAFRESNDLQSAQETIIGILRDARSRSVGSQDKKTYGVHFEATKAVLFKGSVYSASDSANEAYILPTLVKISSITLSAQPPLPALSQSPHNATNPKPAQSQFSQPEAYSKICANISSICFLRHIRWLERQSAWQPAILTPDFLRVF